MKQTKLNRITALLLAAALLVPMVLSLAPVAFAAGDPQVIYINTAEDFAELAKRCTLDTWSQGKKIVLQTDISLLDAAFSTIPTFGGTFDGNGHTISGLSITDSFAPAGLFGILQESAVVKDLTVTGSVLPAGDADTIGGIAGVNYGKLIRCAFQGFVCGSSTVGGVVGLNEGTGQLISCSFHGAVIGEHYVGGIAGWNTGSIIQCMNNGSINTTVVDVKAELSNLNLQQLRSTESVSAGTDIGGIAGFSTGLLQSCKNVGDVGYEHMGYNVGGIAGQLEPQVTLKYSKDTLSDLWDELDVLEELMDRVLSDAEDASDAISGDVSSLSSSVGMVKDTAVDLTGAMTGWANGNIDQINDASARISWVLNQMGPIMDDLGCALEQAEEASGQFADALDDAELAGEWGSKAVAAMKDALTDLQNACEHGSDAYDHVKNSITDLENSLGDAERTKAALKELVDATANMAAAFSEIAGATSGIGDALDGVYQAAQEDPNWQNLRSGMDDLRTALVEISGALAQVSDALETLRQVIDDPENEPTNRELLKDAMDALKEAAAHLDAAYQAFSDALDAYESGNINGDDGVSENLGEGMAALNAANGEVQRAQDDISQILENVEGDPRTEPALEQLADGLADLNAGLGHANDAIVKIDSALREIENDPRYEETKNKIYDYLGDINDAMKTLSDASGRISRAVKELEESVVPEEAEKAWEEIKNAGDDLEMAADDLDKAVSNLKLALEYLEKAGGYGSAAADDLSMANKAMGKAISLLRKATEQAADVIHELAEKPVIQFTPISSDLTAQGDALDSALSQVLDKVDALNETVATSSDILLNDLRAMNRQVGVIIDLLRRAGEEAGKEEAEDRYEDVSDREPPNDQTSGRISASRNEGMEAGDVNVAGIVGSIAIEYDFDPEDDLTKDGDRSLDFRYQTAAVVWDSVNEGIVTAKKNYAGGIAGRMDLGTIHTCQNYGSVESTGGDYVGGIAGLTSGTVRSSFAKCTLEGGRYVGGIVGSGTEATAGDASSIVSGCYSMVTILRFEQYSGAISGDNIGSFQCNFFVSDTLAGINRISYSGKAEPIAYADLPREDAARTVPDAFLRLTLRFIVDGETVKTVPFDYGASFDETVYPEIPSKDGTYSCWDKTELKDLHFDTVVTAVYTPYVSALSNSENRTDGRPIFFVEGQFDDEAVPNVTALPNTSDDFAFLASGWMDFLAGSFSGRTVSREIVEQWKISIPDDGQDLHTVRYLSPDANPEHLDIYVKGTNGWQKADTKIIGSYLAFPVEGLEAEITVISTSDAWWVWLTAALLLLVLLMLIVRLVQEIVKAKRRPPRKAESENRVGECVEMDEPENKPVSSPAPKKKRRWVAPLLIVLAMLVGIGGPAAFFLLPDLLDEVKAYDLLKEYSEKQELTMELTVDGSLGPQDFDFTAALDRTDVEGHRVTAISQDGRTLYYCDGTVFLENGNAYKLSSSFPDYSQLLNQAMELYRYVDMDEKDGTYTITAEGADAKAILELLMPSAAGQLADTNTMKVELFTDGDEVSEIHFSGNGTLNDREKPPFDLSVVLMLHPENRDRIPIPEAVRNAVLSGEYEASEAISDDLLRMANAWQSLNGADSVGAKLLLKADCGPVTLDDRLDFYRWNDGGTQISSIQKNGYALYFTDTMICNQNGSVISTADATTVKAAKLLNIAYQTCLNAQFDCSQADGKYTYTLSLDEDGMEAVAYAIAPAAEGMDIFFDSGSIQVVICEDQIQSIDVNCGGTVQIVLSNAKVAFEAQMEFVEGTDTAAIPEAVKETLEK